MERPSWVGCLGFVVLLWVSHAWGDALGTESLRACWHAPVDGPVDQIRYLAATRGGDARLLVAVSGDTVTFVEMTSQQSATLDLPAVGRLVDIPTGYNVDSHWRVALRDRARIYLVDVERESSGLQAEVRQIIGARLDAHLPDDPEELPPLESAWFTRKGLLLVGAQGMSRVVPGGASALGRAGPELVPSSAARWKADARVALRVTRQAEATVAERLRWTESGAVEVTTASLPPMTVHRLFRVDAGWVLLGSDRVVWLPESGGLGKRVELELPGRAMVASFSIDDHATLPGEWGALWNPRRAVIAGVCIGSDGAQHWVRVSVPPMGVSARRPNTSSGVVGGSERPFARVSAVPLRGGVGLVRDASVTVVEVPGVPASAPGCIKIGGKILAHAGHRARAVEVVYRATDSGRLVWGRVANVDSSTAATSRWSLQHTRTLDPPRAAATGTAGTGAVGIGAGALRWSESAEVWIDAEQRCVVIVDQGHMALYCGDRGG